MPKILSLTYLDDYKTEKTLHFSLRDSKRGLSTTIITGENGTGKSSILKKIVDYYFLRDRLPVKQILDLKSNQDSYFEIIDNKTQPTLLAISGTSSDRFPIHVGIFQNNYDDHEYVYLGQKVNSNLLSKKRSLETIVSHLLNQHDGSKLNSPILSELYSIIGIQPGLKISLKTDLNISAFELRTKHFNNIWTRLREIQEAVRNNLQTEYIKGLQRSLHISLNTVNYILKTVEKDDILQFEEFIRNLEGNKSININVNVNYEVYSKELKVGSIRLGILLGFFKINEVLVRSKSSDKQFSILDLSSGEFHFLTSILGIHFCADSDSIILIDEPENSLHPKWQMDFMNLLYKACGIVTGGHLVISTHSPLIVGSATPETVIIDMSKKEGYEPNLGSLTQSNNRNYGASLEAILMDQFGLVNSRNLHFIDLLQRVIDLFSNGDTKNPEFIDGLDQLLKIKNKLKLDDPLVELISVLSGEHNND